MPENKNIYENIYTTEERKELIADSLSSLRKAKRLTQKYVAEKIGIQTQTYATYERGRNEPSAEILVRLSFLYDVPIDVLVQKDNLTKDKSTLMKQLDNFDAIIDEFRDKILSGDAETREQIKHLADSVDNMLEFMRDVGEKLD